VVAGNISLPYGAASGDGNTITATLPVTSDFSDGGAFIIRANANNAGTINTPNLQINSYASRRIKKIGGVALIANDIVSGMNMVLVYHEAQDCYYLINHEATFLKRDGTAKMLGAIDMDSHKITNLTAGTANGDAVNYLQLGGDAAREFAVAEATAGDSAVNKTQFDAKTALATDTVAGIVEKATQAEMNAGTADKFPSALEIRCGFASDFTQNGSITLPSFMGGLIIEWGRVTYGDLPDGSQHNSTVSFTNTFTNILTAQVSAYSPDGGSNAFTANLRTITLTDLTIVLQEWSGGYQGATAGYNWLVIGV